MHRIGKGATVMTDARLVGRRCACRSRSPARSPRSPWLPGRTP